MRNHCSQMRHCKHSLPSSVYHSRTLKTHYCFHWTCCHHNQHHQLFYTIECERLPGLLLLWKILYCNLLCHWSVEQICGWMSFRDGWCLMDAFRLNYFIRFKRAHSNNRWHKFHGRQHKKILWVYGPQSALTLLFRKWRFWWLRLHHPLGLCLGIPHCRTSTITCSRTLFLLLIVEKEILITIQCPYRHSTKWHWWVIYCIPSPQYQSSFSGNSCYSIMVWVFGHCDYTFIPYLAYYTFKMTQCNERKALISKVGDFEFILLIIAIALSKINMN